MGPTWPIVQGTNNPGAGTEDFVLPWGRPEDATGSAGGIVEAGRVLRRTGHRTRVFLVLGEVVTSFSCAQKPMEHGLASSTS